MRGLMLSAIASLAAFQSCEAVRNVYSLNYNWKFEIAGPPPLPPACNSSSTAFPIDLDNQQCFGLNKVSAQNVTECFQQCCRDSSCNVYQYCGSATCAGGASQGDCFIGPMNSGCGPGNGWLSRGRHPAPPGPGANSTNCTDPACLPGTDDSSWRSLNVPHDFVVEGVFSPSADKVHGYLPFAVGWYRKHITMPTQQPASPNTLVMLEFEGVQTLSTVFWNGALVGQHVSGYTASRYYINSSLINWNGQDNLLAVQADSTNPDGWWYDGGGIYRNVWMTVLDTPGPYIAPWGVYAGNSVTGPISWGGNGVPTASAIVTPSVEVWCNASGTATQAFSLSFTIFDPSGLPVASSTGNGGSVPSGGGVVLWNATAGAGGMTLNTAQLWHLVEPPAAPALYVLQTVLMVGGQAVDSVNVTFGVRTIRWDAATGFYLNGVSTKIKGTANHQDFAGIGVAIPDHLQWHRVAALKAFGVNGWRTAHNPPTPALLHAADALGMVVWDENHRNGQYWELPNLVKRDRNHPSVVIWSICNEVLCETSGSDWVQNALMMKGLIHGLDWMGSRPVSANQNGWVGPSTPLDVQGFDYSTGNYDKWHSDAPTIPSISSETSSAVSDRGEYVNNASAGYVSGYDVNYPGWGQTAQGAWGGIGQTNGQGILTRPFISGGWTWTGWDYRGEPTPDAWPDINSHFGIIDLAGFPKDRMYWYKAWYLQPQPVPELYLFPHWNWEAGATVNVWVYSNADAVELFVCPQGSACASQGVKYMAQYSHVEWSVQGWTPGSMYAQAYMNSTGLSTPVATMARNTTGAPAALNISIKDDVGSNLIAGCADVALVQVSVVDSNGFVVPYATTNVTFTVTGAGAYIGGGNGDPTSHVLNKSPWWPAYHGLLLGVVQAGDSTGTITVTASADAAGLQPVVLNLPVNAPPAGFSQPWCHLGPRL